MKKGRSAFLAVVAFSFVLLMMAVSVFQWHAERVDAGPLKAPTPISAPAGGEGSWIMVEYIYTNTTDADLHSNGVQTARYTTGDFQHKVDVASNQTVTCYLEWSNDKSNWDRGLTVINAKSADEVDMQQYNMFGRYSRITCTLGTANAVSVEVKAKLFR